MQGHGIGGLIESFIQKGVGVFSGFADDAREFFVLKKDVSAG